MRRALVLCLVVCSACPAPSARLELNKTALEFFTVEVNGGEYRLPLTLSNPGEKTIKLSELRLESQSAELQLEANFTELAAGERRVAVVIYKPVTEGSVSGEVRLNADDGGGVRTIPVSGRAGVRNATLTPSAGAICGDQPLSLNFGTVTSGTAASRTVTIASTGTTALAVLKANAPTGAGFVISGPFGSAIEPGQSVDFTITWDPRIAGPQSGAIEFVTTSVLHPRLPVEICGTAMVSALCVTPNELNLGAAAAGTTVVGAFNALNCGNLPVTLQTVTLTADANVTGLSLGTSSTLPLVLAPAASTTIPVRYVSTSPLAARGVVTLTSSSPLTPTLEVPVGANLPPPCNLQFSPTTVNFFFASPRKSVRLTNRGNTECVVQRIGVAPSTAPFELERDLPFPLTIPRRGTLDLGLIFNPANGSATAKLEVEVDFVHTAKLVGDASTPTGCHLISTVSKIDFGLIRPNSAPTATFGLQNIGTGECLISSLTSDHPEFVITSGTAISPNTVMPVTIEFVPATPGPVSGKVTVISSDAENPELEVELFAGHYLCDPDCQCGDDEVLTYWRYSATSLSSAVAELGPNGAFARSCDLALCAAGQVQLEIARGELTCVQKPPECPTGSSLDFVSDGWRCASCEVLVQFGSLFDNERVCTTKPNLTCNGSQVPTFDAYSHEWECRQTCNNSLYDQATFPDGTRVCIPC
ncbi:MAG: choice-of-anchor D domain-containing protein [Archangium sp.]